MTPHVLTYSGLQVPLNDPQPHHIRLPDIAVSLSRLPRWGGHTVRPYTAAEDALIQRMRIQGVSYGAIGRALTPPRCHSSVLGRLTTLARHAAVEEADA